MSGSFHELVQACFGADAAAGISLRYLLTVPPPPPSLPRPPSESTPRRATDQQIIMRNHTHICDCVHRHSYTCAKVFVFCWQVVQASTVVQSSKPKLQIWTSSPDVKYEVLPMRERHARPFYKGFNIYKQLLFNCSRERFSRVVVQGLGNNIHV